VRIYADGIPREMAGDDLVAQKGEESMARDVLGMSTKRGIILLAVMAAVMFSASGLMPGEPDAQTTSTNGQIAYVGFDAETQKQDVYTMNPDGTGTTNLTRRYTDPNWSPLSNAHGDPEWSPDSTKISFTGTALSDIGSCCSRNVYVMNADGTDLQRLTETASSTEGEDYGATWAPDGSWLAFTSIRSDGPRDPDNPDFSSDREIYRMNADGSNERQLTATSTRYSDEQPSISPDGTKIAFASNRHWDTTGFDQLDIYIMNADGSGEPRRLTFDAAPTYPLETRSQNPAWSPDGTRIAYESTRGLDGKGEIFVTNADGSGEPINVSNHPDWDTDPAWSPDGTQITFTSERAGQRDIWAVDAPPASSATTPAAALLPLSLSTDAAWAASEPRNLTPGSGVEAHNPDWGTAPPSGTNTCTIQGTASANTISGTSGADVICAGAGNDTVKGLGGNDTLKGQGGNDQLLGGADKDKVVGNAGADFLYGDGGADTVNSKDTVNANDSLDGGAGTDTKVSDDTEKSIVNIP
jgi:Tol biopolymer transport system component